MHWRLDFGRPGPPLNPAFVLRGQPKGLERMFALKVQTNILFDYFQTDLHETPRCRPFCLDSQDKHRISSPKIQLLPKQTPTAHTQSSCCCFTRKNKLTYQNWKICSWFALIYTVQFHGLVRCYVSLTSVWCIDRLLGKRYFGRSDKNPIRFSQNLPTDTQKHKHPKNTQNRFRVSSC